MRQFCFSERIWGIVLWLTMMSGAWAQTTYYVSAGGQDTNDGKSVVTPFRTITKVNSLSLNPGDAILFRRGDTFRGTLTIRQSGTAGKPIRVDAYGSGERPLLSGAVPLTNWTATATNRWQANCPDCGSSMTGVYRNGVPQPLGRYPNPEEAAYGYMTVQSHVGKTQLTSRQPLSTNWVGGEVVLRPTHWIIDRAPISAQSGSTLFLANTSSYDLTDGWGYFIQNHPATLDQNGEWYYDAAKQTVTLYESRDNPNTQQLTATLYSDGINIADAAHISIQTVQLAQTLNHGLYASNVSSLTITGVDVTASGEDGITLAGTGSDVVIRNTLVADINNNGINIGAYQNVTLQGNTLRSIGLQPGRGKSGDGQFCGIQSMARSVLIADNLIDGVGYNAISVGSNSTVQQNIIRNFCAVKSDGGGIYMWNGLKQPMSNVRLQRNIVQGGIGTTSGTADTVFSGAHGIFLDDCVLDVDVVDNTVSDCHGIGMALHGVSNVRLLRNVCFNNYIGQMGLFTYNGFCPPRDNVIRQNLFVARGSTQSVVSYLSNSNDITQFGTFDHNYYVRPLDDVLTVNTVYNGNVGAKLALPQWQDQFVQDLFSHTSPLDFPAFRVQSVAARRIDDSFGQQVSGWDAWSSRNNGQISWESTSRLDAGSLKIAFPTLTLARDSYMLLYKQMQAVTKGKTYLLQFDAITQGVSLPIDVYIRRRNEPYSDLATRSTRLTTTDRQHYEVAFTATDDEPDALLAFQIQENGQPIWLDNIRIQEATIKAVNPDEYIRLLSNPSPRDSTISLDTRYRDLRSRAYSGSITLTPLQSVMLLRDSLPTVDVSLSMQLTRQTVQVEDNVAVSVTLHSGAGAISQVPNRVQWACRLPAGLTLIDSQGFVWRDSTVLGTVQKLTRDTTFTFRVRAVKTGAYQIGAQVTETAYADPNSSSDSGTDDNENDMARISLRVVARGSLDTAGIVTATEPTLPALLNAVYPNPSTGSFTFITDGDLQRVRVLDLLGREYLQLGPARLNQSLQFGAELPVGQYVLRLQYTSGDARSVRLVKTSP